ncbi:fibronectin type III domain-containing protein [Deinococcus pimensis]|uniref:fibronectin type III domain-containing protein n=1 Tax=Deinococcus pimensis TaxID=309888 RepID=UPI00047FB108|nr:fibronectin type III domain-containing protein [Deinococcus pimensis]
MNRTITSRLTFRSLALLTAALTLAACGGPGGGTLPTDVTTFEADATDSATVTLSWSAASGAANYTLERKTNGGAYASVTAPLDANTRSYTDAGLTPSTSYTYRLKTTNSLGASVGVERAVRTPAEGDRDFTLNAGPRALTVSAGRSATVQVTLERPANPEGLVTLGVDGPTVGTGRTRIDAAFGGSEGRVLTLSVGQDVPVGAHTLTLRGRNGTVERTVTLTVNVERWLVVDDDSSVNNSRADDPAATPDSQADLRVRGAMNAANVAYDVHVVEYDLGGNVSGPDVTRLREYSGVLWYTGDRTEKVLTPTDLQNAAAFVNDANRALILLSPGLVHNAVGGRGDLQTPDEPHRTFLQGTAGVTQVAYGPSVGTQPYTLTGQDGTVTQGLSLNVAASIKGFLLPGSGTLALLRDGAAVSTTGRAGAGTAGSSRVIVSPVSVGFVTQPDANALLSRFLRF